MPAGDYGVLSIPRQSGGVRIGGYRKRCAEIAAKGYEGFILASSPRAGC